MFVTLGTRSKYRYLSEDIKQQSQDGKINPDPLPTKPEPEVFRHGVHPTSHVHRYKAPAKKDDVVDSLNK